MKKHSKKHSEHHQEHHEHGEDHHKHSSLGHSGGHEGSSKHGTPHGNKDSAQQFVHEHDDHFHMHEHYHGGQENIIITTIGLVIHSIADGTALGASFYCNLLRKSKLYSEWDQ